MVSQIIKSPLVTDLKSNDPNVIQTLNHMAVNVYNDSKLLPQLHGLGHHDLWPNFTQFKIYGNNDEEAAFSQFKPVAVDLHYRDPVDYAEMLHIEADIERKKLKEELQNCLRSAVQVDGSVDTKQQDKKFVFVRYHDRNFPISIQTRLVSPKEVKNVVLKDYVMLSCHKFFERYRIG